MKAVINVAALFVDALLSRRRSFVFVYIYRESNNKLIKRVFHSALKVNHSGETDDKRDTESLPTLRLSKVFG